MSRRPGYRGKRALDLVLVATAALPALVLGLVCAALVRVTSTGPVVFRQERAGLDGERFTLLKFRTMRHDPGGVAGLPDADRITAVGRILRRTSLDELPQLVNVLRGEMSIVGPRPTLPYQVERYDERQRGRLAVRPGVTGLAQVEGRNELPWSERIELDLDYVERMSLRLDLWILWRSVAVVFRGGGVEGHPTDDPIAAAPQETVPATSSAVAGGRRILMFRQHLQAPVEGGSMRGLEFARRLASEGHDVRLVVGPRVEVADLPKGMVIESLDVPYSQAMSFARRKLAFLQYVAGATWRAIARPADVVFASSTPLLVFVPALVAKLRRPRARLVLEVRDLWPAIPISMGALPGRIERVVALALERLSYRWADGIISLSPGMDEYIREVSGRPTVVVTNGSSSTWMGTGSVDPAQVRSDLGIDGDAPVVLYAGSVGAVNDPAYLGELVREVALGDSAVHVVVLGSGTHFHLVRADVDDLANVHVVDRVPRSQVPAYFQLADVSLVTFVDVPLIGTNSANKFFDSLAAGCPVAVNYGGWQEDLLVRSGSGLRLPRDPVVAARVLLAWLGSPSRHEAPVAAARVSEQFEWSVLYEPWRAELLGLPSSVLHAARTIRTPQTST